MIIILQVHKVVTPESTASSSWSHDGVDDQKSKPSKPKAPPIPPREIIAGAGKIHGCKPNVKAFTYDTGNQLIFQFKF